jgi:hypothetical protein
VIVYAVPAGMPPSSKIFLKSLAYANKTVDPCKQIIKANLFPLGTELPKDLLLVHERSDHYSLQPAVSMSINGNISDETRAARRPS